LLGKKGYAVVVVGGAEKDDPCVPPE